VAVLVVAILVCGRFEFLVWPFWSDLWPFWLWPFWFVAVLDVIHTELPAAWQLTPPSYPGRNLVTGQYSIYAPIKNERLNYVMSIHPS